MVGRTILTMAILAALAGEALATEAPASPTVNINTASVAELKLLPRVGPALAERIIEFRTANGPFKAPEELVRVKGIGEKSFALLKPHVSVSGKTTLREKVKATRKTEPAQAEPAKAQPAKAKEDRNP